MAERIGRGVIRRFSCVSAYLLALLVLPVFSAAQEAQEASSTQADTAVSVATDTSAATGTASVRADTGAAVVDTSAGMTASSTQADTVTAATADTTVSAATDTSRTFVSVLLGLPWWVYAGTGVIILLLFSLFVIKRPSDGTADVIQPDAYYGYTVQLDGALIVLGNAQHIGRRKEQQDAFGFSDTEVPDMTERGLLAVVADGMGGMALGKEAGSGAINQFLAAYGARSPEESIPQALHQALYRAQDAVCGLAEHAGHQDDMGATLIAAVIHRDGLYWISVGDSRIYLLRGTRLTQLTVDHNHERDLLREIAAGGISREEAEADPDRTALTSYLGIDDLQRIDRNVRPFPLQQGDRVLLCTDGLYGVISEEEMVETLRQDPQHACEALVQQAVGKGYERQDNVTAVVLACERLSDHANGG